VLRSVKRHNSMRRADSGRDRRVEPSGPTRLRERRLPASEAVALAPLIMIEGRADASVRKSRPAPRLMGMAWRGRRARRWGWRALNERPVSSQVSADNRQFSLMLNVV
jgi:hypothetical protein